jgi:hypothetical protein
MVRIYYFRGEQSVSGGYGTTPNPVRMLGDNASWTDTESPHPSNPRKKLIDVKIGNLVAGGHCVFTSPLNSPSWCIDDAIQRLIGARYPAGLYEF